MTPGIADKTFRPGEQDSIRSGKLNLILTALRSVVTAAITALAGLTPAADMVPYYTSSTAASLTSLTSYGRSLIGGADAAAVRLTLGLGTMATQNANAVAITGGSAQLTGASSLTGATSAESTFQLAYTGTPGAGASSRVQFLTASVPSAVNQRTGTFNFAAYSTGTTVVAGCSIIGKTLNAWSSTDAGSYLQFNACPAGSVTTAEIARLTGGVGLLVAGSILSNSATLGIGYATGAGGTATQATSKATGVTLDKACGQVTMNGAALAAGTIVSFQLTNSAIAAGDVLALNHVSGGTQGAYTLTAACGAGVATVYVRNNTAGSLSEAIVLGFALIKAVIS